MADKQPEIVTISQQAFDNFTQGLATGKWQPFLNLLTEDFRFWFPVGTYKGWNVGIDRAAEFFQFASQVFTDVEVILERVSYSDTTAVFEFRSQGTLRGQNYQNQAAVSFDIRGNKICSYREYLAVVFPPSPEARSPSAGSQPTDDV